MVQEAVIQVVAAFFAALGFGILFRSRGKKLLLTALGGMAAWGLFLLLEPMVESEPLRYFIVAVVCSIYAEVLARLCKTPASTFAILTLIVLVPGGGWYYAADCALRGDMAAFLSRTLHALTLTAALSLGIVLVATVAKFFSAAVQRRHRG